MNFGAQLKVRWHRSPVQPFDAAEVNISSDSNATTTRSAVARWRHRIPRTDIRRSIRFSKTRFVMSLVSLALLVTDIPRTGLGVYSITEYFPVGVAPDTVIRFGPYAYPVAHITCTTPANHSSGSSMDCQGQSGAASLANVGAWPYGYDTTSIGIRSIATLFNMTPEFPAFLLNQGSDRRRGDTRASISLEDTFHMLDKIVGATQTKLGKQDSTSTMNSVKITTRYNFLDRLHDYFIKYFLAGHRTRDFVLQAMPKKSRSPHESFDICESVHKRQLSIGPALCNHQVPWLVDHPVDITQPPIAIWDHVTTRLQILQTEYPDLWLDVSLLSSQELTVAQSMTRATFYNLESADLLVLVRGRVCQPAFEDGSSKNCTTVFVDDYRYERYLMSTNVSDWYDITATLRGLAQAYVWIRLALLLYASYTIQPQQLSVRTKLLSAADTISRIPFHVVVYGSSIPVVCYVLAHLIDGNFVDVYLEVYWASVGGALQKANILGFIRVASVQMRNVWIIALLAKLRVMVETRRSRWRIDLGVSGVRGLAISFTSFLSIFGPYRSISFRNCDVVDVFLLGESGSNRANWVQSESSALRRVVSIGESTAMMFAAIIVVIALSLLVVAALGPRGNFGVLFAPSVAIPHAAGRLWPLSALAIRFYCSTDDDETIPGPMPRHVAGPSSSNVECLAPPSDLVPAIKQSIKWRRVLNVIRGWQELRVPVGRDLLTPSVVTRSLILLVNATMMSDPWVFAQLRLVGTQLYIYEIRQPGQIECSYEIILPYPPDIASREIGVPNQYYRFVERVNSRNIPVAVVFHCA